MKNIKLYISLLSIFFACGFFVFLANVKWVNSVFNNLMWTSNLAQSEMHGWYTKPEIGIASDQLNSIKKELRKNIINEAFYSDVDIIVPDSSISNLNSDLPKSGYNYEKGLIRISPSEKYQKVKLRYRGDRAWHYGLPHKSWRIKTKKKELVDGYRKINLIIPKSKYLLHNHSSYLLANLMEIKAPVSEMVFVRVNGVRDGIRLKVSQIDESFLRLNKLMPTDIYVGESISSDERFKGDFSHINIFSSQIFWEKASCNNHYDCSSKKPIEALINSNDKELLELVDIKEFAKMAVYLDLIDSTHVDNQHNWRLFYDPYKEKFIPIVWDPVGWWLPSDSPDINQHEVSSLLMARLHKIRSFMIHKASITAEFRDNLDHVFSELLQNEIDVLLKKIKNNKGYYDNRDSYVSVSEAESNFLHFKKQVTKRMKYVYERVRNTSSETTYAKISDGIRLFVPKNAFITDVFIKQKNHVFPHKAKVVIKFNNNDVEYFADTEVSVTGKVLRVKGAFLPAYNEFVSGAGYAGTSIKFHSKPMTYDILYADNGIHDIEMVSVAVNNYSNAKVVKETKNIKKLKSSWNIVDGFGNQTVDSKIWSGEVVIEEDVEIFEPLVISGGTRVRMAPGVVVRISAPVTAITSKDNPIKFERLDLSKPWGSFVLKRGSDNSVFENVMFSGGSGAKGELFEYTAMVTAHDIKGLKFTNVEFSDSSVTDDMVHLVYSDVVFENCTFKNSFSDALDADISQVVINNSKFISSGNDAVDLMSTVALITETVFDGSLDKGISIGEDSRLITKNLKFYRNNIAAQAKDNSRALMINSFVKSNKIDFDAYAKNWRYGAGGQFYLLDTERKQKPEFFDTGYFSANVRNKSKIYSNIKLNKLHKSDKKIKYFTDKEEILKMAKESLGVIPASYTDALTSKGFINE